MAVTAQLYDVYNAHRQVAIDYANTTYGKDLSDVELVIIPAESGIECGAAGNPAIYLNKSSKPDKIAEKYTNPLNTYKTQHPAEEIRVDRIVVDPKLGKCVLAKEMEATTPEATLLLVAILWHELGHGFNERKPQTNDEHHAYRFELEMLGAATPWAYLQSLGITMAHLLAYLKNRYQQYVIGPNQDDTLVQLQDFVKTLCEPMFEGTPSTPPTGQLKFAVKINGKLYSDTFFTLNLQDTIGRNGAAMQQGLRAVIAASGSERKKIRTWVWLNVAGQRALGRNIKVLQYEADHTPAEVQFYGP
jgi:hypothetical protein